MFWLEKCVLATVEPDTEGPVLVFDPAHPQFSIGIVWIGGMVERAYTIYNVRASKSLARPTSCGGPTSSFMSVGL